MRSEEGIQNSQRIGRFSTPLEMLVVWMLLALLAGSLQWAGGAYQADFAGHPDEGAHFVTGLMVRDYLVGGIPGHPMRFAENYYAHYPKVALGHYPPGFYLLEGLWLAVFPVGRAAVMALMALLAGGLGLLTFIGARRAGFSRWLAWMLAILCLALPLTQSLAAMVMSDLLLGVLVVTAGLWFARYLERGHGIDSLAFGVLAAAAAMTKGSGLLLALLPGLVILTTGRFQVLARGSLWLAVPPVVLICGPWFWFSSSITAEGMSDRGVGEHLAMALPYFGRGFPRVFGWFLVLPALAGLVWVLANRSVRRQPFWAVMVGLPVALVLFYSLIPAGLEPRYLLPVVPPVLVLAAAGIRWAAAVVAEPRRPWAVAGLSALTAAGFAREIFAVPEPATDDFRFAARQVFEARPERPLRLLISSDARGEGAFISEVAILDQARPGQVVDRGSKVLATSDWLGRGYRESHGSDGELAAFLTETGYDGIVIDAGIPAIFRKPHHERIERVAASGGLAGVTVVLGAGDARDDAADPIMLPESKSR